MIITKFKKQFNQAMTYLGIFFLIFFLLFNIVYSQNISTLYLKLIKNNKENVVLYLQKIRLLDFFNKELENNQKLYGYGLEKQVFAKELALNSKIKEFERLLERNPKSRDILFGLYQLYLEKGDKKTSLYYLNQAKEIDPNI